MDNRPESRDPEFLLEVSDLVQRFAQPRGILDRLAGKPQKVVHAVNGVSFAVRRGEVSTEGHDFYPYAKDASGRLLRAGDRVVLAPACSSFDMFENFEHRGRIFKQEVEALARVRA